MKKTTKFESFTAIYNFLVESEKSEWADVIAHEIELLEKKKGENRKPTATQVANASLAEAILDAMEEGQGYTITEMIKGFECCTDLSTQKVSPIVNKLVDEGKLTKFNDKRRTLFQKVC